MISENKPFRSSSFGVQGAWMPGGELEERVEEALLEDENVQAHLIQVSREGSIIYLRGRALNARGREAATRAAAKVLGVQAVVNELELRGRG